MRDALPDRGQILLDAIYDEVDRRLNPTGDECWHCGGEGWFSDCFEEFACIDPEGGCDDCTRRCPECAHYEAARAKAVREEVIKTADADVAIAWLKSVGRWQEGISREFVLQELTGARTAPTAGGGDAG